MHVLVVEDEALVALLVQEVVEESYGRDRSGVRGPPVDPQADGREPSEGMARRGRVRNGPLAGPKECGKSRVFRGDRELGVSARLRGGAEDSNRQPDHHPQHAAAPIVGKFRIWQVRPHSGLANLPPAAQAKLNAPRTQRATRAQM